LEAGGIQPFIDVRGSVDLLGLLEKVIPFWPWVGLTFQAGPFHRLSVGRTANDHLLTANHDYDVTLSRHSAAARRVTVLSLSVWSLASSGDRHFDPVHFPLPATLLRVGD
jgi:hypothetical protein